MYLVAFVLLSIRPFVCVCPSELSSFEQRMPITNPKNLYVSSVVKGVRSVMSCEAGARSNSYMGIISLSLISVHKR